MAKKPSGISAGKEAKNSREREGKLVGVPLVGIIMGSDSDLPPMAEAARILDKLGVAYELTIVSAHRTPLRMVDYARGAQARGIKVIIAGAGGAAHLPGMVASMTTLPVIGVPILAKALQGLDSLLSIVQMPAGIPVATVAINNSANAGLLAARILATGDEKLDARLVEYQSELEVQVLSKANHLESDGWQTYLTGMNDSK